MIQVTIILSILIGFTFNFFFGLLSGGMVSAGYLAFFMNQPYRIVTTLLLSIVIYLILLFLKKYIIIFGRRRFALTMLISIILSSFLEYLIVGSNYFTFDIRIIGYIIPGLIANDMQKQGSLKTLCSILLIASIIFLIVHLGV